MIVFEKISYKNFLSVGNNPVHIDFRKNRTTLIVGANGEGKSILLDALSYGLFGKPHRNVNKPQLINSINEKQCLVEVEFSIGRDSYKVIRGMKPGIFEIWKNDEMLNQNSKSRDYQKVLETNILKLNHKSFHQIVVLGSSSFIPFMQLSAHHRREVIEDLLDISIFSKMNGLLKERRSKTKDDLVLLENDIQSLNNQIALQNKHIQEIREISFENNERIRNEIDEIEKEVHRLQNELNQYVKEYDSLEDVDLTKVALEKKKLYGFEYSIKNKISSLQKEEQFFHENDSCPRCSQSIAKTTKSKMLSKLQSKLEESKEGFKLLDKQIQKLETKYQELTQLNDKRNSISSKINTTNYSIQNKQSELQKKIEILQEASKQINVKENLDTLDQLKNNCIQKQSEKIELAETQHYYGLIDELLKDTGIKTKIIRQYLPIMNKLINEYLHVFDFFVSFTLDENFSEKIRSRHRDDFSYDSFSEGEKARIDLALMFTWRQIAKLKNSTNTNLLILDETFDSSLDTDGVENLLKVLYTLDKDTNTFIISHKSDVLDGKFENKLLFRKKNNFTEMVNGVE